MLGGYNVGKETTCQGTASSGVKAPQSVELSLLGGLRGEEHSYWGQKASCFCLNTHFCTDGVR